MPYEAKKTVPDPDRLQASTGATVCAYTARYEALRLGALGQAIAPEARAGLMVFLRRGMWAWAQRVVIEPPPRPAALRRSTFVPAEQDQILARLLAGMALATVRSVA